MGRKRKKRPATGLAPLDAGAFDQVDPANVPHRASAHSSQAPRPTKVTKPTRAQIERRTERSARWLHGGMMIAAAIGGFLVFRLIASQESERLAMLRRVRDTFVETTCTIESASVGSGNKTGAQARYTYSYVVSGREHRAYGYAPDGPFSARTWDEARNAFPVRSVHPCWFDPASPDTAFLKREGVSTSGVSPLLQWLMLPLALMGVFVAVGWVKPR